MGAFDTACLTAMRQIEETKLKEETDHDRYYRSNGRRGGGA